MVIRLIIVIIIPSWGLGSMMMMTMIVVSRYNQQTSIRSWLVLMRMKTTVRLAHIYKKGVKAREK